MDVAMAENGSLKVHELFPLDRPPQEMVTIKSSDNVLFHIQRRFLELNTGAFPGPEFETNGEVVSLTESASVLGLLFQFVKPTRHPILEDISPNLVLSIAEAAEKYEVFPAMSVTVLRMRSIVAQDESLDYSLSIFKHAIKHNCSPVLMDEAARNCAFAGWSKMLKILPPNMITPWARYQEKWESAFRAVTADLQRIVIHSRDCDSEAVDEEYGEEYAGICIHCSYLASAWILHMSQTPKSMIRVQKLLAEKRTHSWRQREALCEACVGSGACMYMDGLASSLKLSFNYVRPFSQFLE